MSAHIQGTVSAHRHRDSADTWAAAAGTCPEADKAPGGFIQDVLFIAHTQSCANNNEVKINIWL